MGWHYGPCKRTNVIALLTAGFFIYAAIETSKHIQSVEHFFITLAIVLGAICGTCTLAVAGLFYGAHRRDRIPTEVKKAGKLEDEAIRRARELL